MIRTDVLRVFIDVIKKFFAFFVEKLFDTIFEDNAFEVAGALLTYRMRPSAIFANFCDFLTKICKSKRINFYNFSFDMVSLAAK